MSTSLGSHLAGEQRPYNLHPERSLRTNDACTCMALYKMDDTQDVTATQPRFDVTRIEIYVTDLTFLITTLYFPCCLIHTTLLSHTYNYTPVHTVHLLHQFTTPLRWNATTRCL